MGKKVLIVGGVAGGASCAARMRRLDETAQIILFERGEYISYANCGLPYHVGNVIKHRNSLLLVSPVASGVDPAELPIALRAESLPGARVGHSLRHGRHGRDRGWLGAVV